MVTRRRTVRNCLSGVLLLLGALLPGSLWSQQAGLSGRVTAASGGQGLPGVTVTALELASGQQTQALTDREGRYRLAALGAGRFRLTVSVEGFAEQGRSVILEAGTVSVADFRLAVGALDEEITVTAARGERALVEVPQAVHVIDARAIEERQVLSPQEAVERTPNMLSGDGNGARAYPIYRGLSTGRVLMMLDGERLNHALMNPTVTLSSGVVDVSQLETIEVVGGAGSSLYGSDAIAGTINMITKPPARPESGRRYAVSLNLVAKDNGDFDRETASFEYADPDWGLRATVARFEQSSYDAGGEAIPPGDFLAFGELAQAAAIASNPASPGVANSFSIAELASGGEVPNGQGEGVNALVDVWFHPAKHHQLRLSALVNDHEDLGRPFASIPFDPTRFTTVSREIDRISLRYEAKDLAGWLPRVAVRAHRKELTRTESAGIFNIDFGSSFVFSPTAGRFVFTGGLSTFRSGSGFSDGFLDVGRTASEVQLNVVPFSNALWITGVQYSKEETGYGLVRRLNDGSGTEVGRAVGALAPDTDYENLGWFSQLEWRPAPRWQVVAGWRWDRWDTQARATRGYPLPGSSELALLDYAINDLSGVLPGFGFDLDGLARTTALFEGGRPLETSSDVWTGNLALTLFLPGGWAPFARWARSYREPLVLERYLFSRFGGTDFAVAAVPNINLGAEKGESLDLGLRVERPAWRGSVIYFHNRIEDLIAEIDSAPLPLLLDPASGETARVGVFFQSVNTGEVELTGWEVSFTGSLPLGNGGSLSPHLALSWLDGRNKTPTPAEVAVVRELYGRSDTPIGLDGSAGDVPFGEVIPFQGSAALRYTSTRQNWFVEYDLEHSADVDRVAPILLTNATFGVLKSFESYTVHTLRGGYSFQGPHPVRLTLALENVTDELYFTPYLGSPAAGRSWVVGLGYRWNS